MQTDLARAGRARDEQVRHPREVGDVVHAVDGLAERERELWKATRVNSRDSTTSRRINRLALRVRDLDADVRFAGHAVNADGFGFERETEVVNQTGDARILDAGVGLELVSRDDGAGADVLDFAR